MKTNRDMEWSFVRECVFYSVVAMICYRNVLFRCLPYASFEESKAILWTAVVCFGAVGVSMALQRHCSMWVFARWLILTYGVYTACAYARTAGGMFAAVAAVCLAVSGVYGVYLHMRTAGRKCRRRPFGRYRNACSSVFAIGALTVMLVLGAGRIFGGNLINASVHKTESGSIDGMVEANMDTLMKLREETWYSLSTREKLNVLQTAANIQAVHLGLPNEIQVGASNLPENTLGMYSDDAQMIRIDLSHLENDSVQDVLDTCFHEIYHSYQHWIADAYREAAPQMKGLYLYRQAAAYAWEFDHYQSSKKDWKSYSTQVCESDSRRYASHMVEAYFCFIDKDEPGC